MIIITGATGFIGQRVIKLLVRRFKPSTILCLVWKKKGPKEKVARKQLDRLGVRIKEVDLLNKDSLKGLSHNPRLMFHLAATTDTALTDHRCNDMGTKNLIEALTLGEKTHFIYTGTCVLYCGRPNCQIPITEKSKPSPSNRYTRSKWKAEKFLIRQTKIKKFKLSILRPPTVYGANPRENSLFDFMKKMIIEKSPLVRLNWPGLTSLVWVDDMARAIIWAIKNPPKPGRVETIVVSTESITLADISRLMHEKLGVEYKPINLPIGFWKLVANARRFIYANEKFLPTGIYNLFWRATLIADDVLHCNAKKMERLYPTWKPSFFKEKVDEIA